MQKKPHAKPNRGLKFLALILLYLGVGLICLPFAKNAILLEKTATAQVQEVKTLNQVKSIPFEAVQAPTIRQALTSNNQLTSIGRLQVGTVGLDVPVFAGLGQSELLYGAGSMYPKRDPKTNNLVLAAHHLGTASLLFGRLMQAKVGNVIQLRYLGQLYQYHVTSKRVVNDTNLAVLKESRTPQLTLITCDQPTATTGRLIVTATLDSKPTTHQLAATMTQRTSATRQVQQSQRWWQFWLPLVAILVVLPGLSYLIVKKV
ncbi:class A sortase [Lacticaseibacillus brantae]|uniref:class A sortase n=1 Tax=Lacticaseibacillus brantae TaxID=943673 RepID=UPI00070B184A|nr:class A sortase [Lacticaseibacillus brantae]